MWNTKRKPVAILAGIGLLAFSGLASAQEEPAEEPEDTLFNFGYDEEFQLFVWNTSDTEGTYDCTLENGAVNATYVTAGDGSVVVDALTTGAEGDETDVTFPGREDEALLPHLYSADDECGLDAAQVAGPNGQINHGMFMKLFNSLYEGTGRGCLNRHLAQSDLGKGDQQIRVSEVDATFEPVMDGDTGEVIFSTFAADCERGNNGDKSADADANIHTNGNGSANNSNGNNGNHNEHAPETASDEDSKHDDSRGRSGDAPGHNT